MPDLVHRLLLRPHELPVLVDRLLLEEVADLVAGRQEVVVPDVVVVAGREFRLRVISEAMSFDRVDGHLTRGWSSRLKLFRSCCACVKRASVSSGLRKLGKRRYLASPCQNLER